MNKTIEEGRLCRNQNLSWEFLCSSATQFFFDAFYEDENLELIADFHVFSSSSSPERMKQ